MKTRRTKKEIAMTSEQGPGFLPDTPDKIGGYSCGSRSSRDEATSKALAAHNCGDTADGITQLTTADARASERADMQKRFTSWHSTA